MKIKIFTLLLSFTTLVLNAQTKLDFESGIPSNLSASTGSTISLSNEHIKAGANGLKWRVTNKAVLTLSGLNLESWGDNYSKASLLFFIYSNVPSSSDTLIFRFFDPNNKLTREGRMLLNYKGWREYHRNYRLDYGVNDTNGSGILNDKNGVHAQVSKMEIEFRSSPAATRTIWLDELTLIGNSDARIPGLHNIIDYKRYKMDGYNMALISYLYKNDKDGILKSADLSGFLASDLAVVNGNIKDVSSLDTLRKHPNYKNIKMSTIDSLTYTIKKPIVSTASTDALLKYAAICCYLSDQIEATKSSYYKTKLDLFVEYLLDQGIAEGGRIIAPYNNTTLSNMIAIGFLSAHKHLDRALKDDWLNMIKWSVEYNKIYAKEGLEAEGDYLGKTSLITKIALADQDDQSKIIDLFFLRRFLEKYVIPTGGSVGFIKPDSVGFHHGAHHSRYMYNFNHWINRGSELKGTSFRIPADTYKKARSVMKTLLIETSGGIIQANAAAGRAPFSPSFVTHENNHVKDLIAIGQDALRTSLEPELSSFSEYIFKRTNNKFDGFYQLNYAQTGILRKNEWMVSMRGFTNWLWGSEIYIADNRYGRYQSYGALEVLYGNTLSASGYIAEGQGWDWNMMPGTTTVRKSNYGDLDIRKDANGYGTEFQSKAFAGALSFGNDGLFAMDFEQNPNMSTGSESNGQPRYVTDNLKFKKSVFAFNDFMVCLGTGITSSNTNEPVITTLFQGIDQNDIPGLYIKSSTLNKNTINETALPSEDAYNWLINKQNTGYFIPGSNKSVMVFSNGQSTPGKIGSDFDKGTPAPIFSAKATKAWIDHGKATATSAGKYEFAVLPGTTPAQMVTFADNVSKGSVYKVLQQTNFVHAVKYIPENRISYAFFTGFNSSSAPDVDFGKFKSIDQPALLGIRESTNSDTLAIHIADPDLHYVAINSRAKFYTLSSTVSVKLAGKWTLEEKFKGVANETIENDVTSVTFILKDGLSKMVKLVKVKSLPVTMYEFDGKGEQEGNLLKWSSLSETNTDYFTIYRSTDGVNFVKIDTKPAAGSSTDRRDYFYLDNSYPEGFNGFYYRLVLTDKDNKVSYENNIYIKSSKPFNSAKLVIYPNPVVNEATISYAIEEDDLVALQLVDMNGRILLSGNINLPSGKNTIKLDLSSIMTGNYVIRLRGKSIIQEQIIIKQ